MAAARRALPWRSRRSPRPLRGTEGTLQPRSERGRRRCAARPLRAVLPRERPRTWRRGTGPEFAGGTGPALPLATVPERPSRGTLPAAGAAPTCRGSSPPGASKSSLAGDAARSRGGVGGCRCPSRSPPRRGQHPPSEAGADGRRLSRRRPRKHPPGEGSPRRAGLHGEGAAGGGQGQREAAPGPFSPPGAPAETGAGARRGGEEGRRGKGRRKGRRRAGKGRAAAPRPRRRYPPAPRLPPRWGIARPRRAALRAGPAPAPSAAPPLTHGRRPPRHWACAGRRREARGREWGARSPAWARHLSAEPCRQRPPARRVGPKWLRSCHWGENRVWEPGASRLLSSPRSATGCALAETAPEFGAAPGVPRKGKERRTSVRPRPENQEASIGCLAGTRSGTSSFALLSFWKVILSESQRQELNFSQRSKWDLPLRKNSRIDVDKMIHYFLTRAEHRHWQISAPIGYSLLMENNSLQCYQPKCPSLSATLCAF